MKIVIVEPYDTGSHGQWMRGLQRHSRHQITLLTLEGQFWQWRLLGGAVTLAERFRRLELKPDLIVASDMLDLTTFLALTRPTTHNIPAVIYFHENQLVYPQGPRQKLTDHYAFINYVSALAAEAVVFNSKFHREAFFDELPRLLKHFPDHNNLETIGRLSRRSYVLPVGVDLVSLDHLRPAATDDGPPIILWNHRWDFDKNPRSFLDAITRLANEDLAFRVAITGENFRKEAQEFEKARKHLDNRIIQYGYLSSFTDYAKLLWDADSVVSTAIQDFFGISIVEGMYCGCWPILPNRLNYPDLVPPAWHQTTLYATDEGLYHRLRERILAPHPTPGDFRSAVAGFDWQALVSTYDQFFDEIALF
ncbi:MAG: DUF3524 domain-containing protein [Chloroflexi bacterium]|nr:DUF3524 domain-containing protein [Chloroflexota bacterium]